MTTTAPATLRPLLLAVKISDQEARFTVQQGRGLDLVAPVPLLIDLQERGQEVDVDILTLERQPLYSFSAALDSPAFLELCRVMLADQHPQRPVPDVLAVTAGPPAVLIVEGQHGHRQALRADQLQPCRLTVHWNGPGQLVNGDRAYFVPADLIDAVATATGAQVQHLTPPGPDQWNA